LKEIARDVGKSGYQKMNKYQEAYKNISHSILLVVKHFIDTNDNYGIGKFNVSDLSTLHELVNKNTAKIVIESENYFICPNCSLIISNIERGVKNERNYIKYETPSYCKWCGKKLKWW